MFDSEIPQARRVLRSNSLAHAPVTYIQLKSQPGDSMCVVDISELGARVIVPARMRGGTGDWALGIGREQEAVCLLGGHLSIPLRIRVVHRSDDNQAGVEFVEPDERFRRAIRTYFEPELVGASLMPRESGFMGDTVAALNFSDGENREVEVDLGPDRARPVRVLVREHGKLWDWTTDREHWRRALRLIMNIRELDAGVRREIEERFVSANQPSP